MPKSLRKRKKSKASGRGASPPGLPDRRAMERVMAGIVEGLGGRRKGRRTAKDEAQKLIYAAWETIGEERIELALKAIETDPDCADAYVILAEATSDNEEARDLYAQGMAAAQRTLGEKAFKEDVGHFWGILETRPYMRARAGLAQCLWALGERDAAVRHYREMLRLNPGDNQGIRYSLLSCLQDLERDEDTLRLLEEHADDSMAAWAYSWALLDFRREGDSSGARERLGKALELNRHVPAYLLGKKRLPRQLPPYIGFGDESEAVSYAAENLGVWKKTPEALDWLRSVWAIRSPRTEPAAGTETTPS